MNACSVGAWRRRGLWVLGAVAAGMALGGCGFSSGEAAFMLGFGKPKLIEAQFTLTTEPILILLDDPHDRIRTPTAKAFLFDELAQELLRTESAKKIVPYETMQRMRQSGLDFNRRGARELGELAGATQVLWLEVHDAYISPHMFDPNEAAYVTVSVKVLDVKAQKRSKVRLWPSMRAGTTITASLNGVEVAKLGQSSAIAKAVSRKLARSVARLFHAYRPGVTRYSDD